MKIIVDTNIFLATALNEPEKEMIISLTVGHELVAPEVLSFEVGNALSAMVKRGCLTEREGVLAYDEIQKVPVELRGTDIRRAMEIAIHHKIYAYDAYFLECALATRSPLLTLDAAMKALATQLGIALWEEKA